MATKSKYGKRELEELWVKFGGPKAQAQVAAAIALAESKGVPTARNPEGPEHAEGLWQIKGQVVSGNPLNPEVSAANAVAKWKAAKGFTPWTTFTGGEYKKYLDSESSSTLASKGEGALNTVIGGLFGGGGELGAEAVEKVAEPGVEAAGGFVKTEEDLVKSLGAGGAFFETITEPSTWLRIAEGIGGIVLFMVGLKTLTKGTAAAGATNVAIQQGRSVKRTVAKTAETAAVLAK
jgi:hypothetical protein